MGNSLGEKLRQYRNLKGATLRDVYTGTGISNGYLNQLEQDKVKNPSPHILHKLAEFYNVPYERLLKLAGYILPARNNSTKKAAGVAYSQLGDLTEEEEEELLRYLEFIRQKKKTKK